MFSWNWGFQIASQSWQHWLYGTFNHVFPLMNFLWNVSSNDCNLRSVHQSVLSFDVDHFYPHCTDKGSNILCSNIFPKYEQRTRGSAIFAQSNINHDNCLTMRRPIWKDILIQIGEDRVVKDKDDCKADNVINDITIWKREP